MLVRMREVSGPGAVMEGSRGEGSTVDFDDSVSMEEDKGARLGSASAPMADMT